MSSSNYVHQTYNHLFFDRVRAVQFEVDLLKAYLVDEENSRVGGAGLSSEISALNSVSTILFDDVYHSIRQKWM